MAKSQKKRASQKQKRQIFELRMEVQELNDHHNMENQGTEVKSDSSLSAITKRFIELIKKSKDQTINMNFAANELKIQKRRLYDITNVLEGINLLLKTKKNKITWIGKEQDPQTQKKKEGFNNRLNKIKQNQEELDKQVEDFNEIIKSQMQDQQTQKYRFITQEDINSIHKKLCNGNTKKPLLIICAPKGTSLELGQEANGEHSLKIDSQGNGKIHLFKYAINESDGIKESSQQKKGQ